MERTYCGTITFFNSQFDVHWDTNTKKVYVSKFNNPELSLIHYSGYVAPTPEKATETALKMLQVILGER